MKNLTPLFIKKPTFAISLALLIVFCGLYGLSGLSLRLFPSVNSATIIVSTHYPGATAKTMKNYVTNVIQRQLSGIEGVNYITSSSKNENSTISIYLKINSDADKAIEKIIQKINLVYGKLPKAVEYPIVKKLKVDDNPVFLLTFTSKKLLRAALSDYLSKNVKQKIETINGVDKAEVMGSRFAMNIQLNPLSLAGYHLSVNDIITALNRNNIIANPGSIEGKNTNIIISTNSDLSTANQFNQMIIKTINHHFIRLKDIGVASLGNDSEKISAFYGTKPAVMLSIKLNPGSNPLTVIKQIKKMLPSIKRQLPEYIEIHELVDASKFIKASIKEVIITLFISIIIVSIVIYLFLGNLKGILIPLITIPISLIGSCFFLWVFSFSINLLTLLAMVISIGLVVDDAIVMMENIFRHLEKGLKFHTAMIMGANEISSSIITMTITLGIIYIPIAFLNNLFSRLFLEFALTLSATVLISGIIALTLTPLMSSKIFHHQIHNQLLLYVNKIFHKINIFYEYILTFLLQYKKTTVLFCFFSLLGCLLLYSSIPKELAPSEDQGFLQILGTAADSTNTHFLTHNAKKLDSILKQFPNIASASYIVGIPNEHQILSFIQLKDWKKRKQTSIELSRKLQEKLNKFPELSWVSIVPSVLPGTQGFPIEFVIKSMGDYQQLYQVSQAFLDMARKSGLFAFINSDLKYDQPILNIHINRDVAALLGVSIQSINTTLSFLLSKNRIQYFTRNGEVYDVIPKSFFDFQYNPYWINAYHVKSDNGQLIPLSALITIKTKILPESFNQFQKLNSITLSGVMSKNHTISEGLHFLSMKAKENLPRIMSYDYAGKSRQFMQQSHDIIFVTLAGCFLIFLILAVQFENFIDPLIILFGSIPLSLISAISTIKLASLTINMYTQISLLTLMGLSCKHGILITKFANDLKNKGHAKLQATIISAKTRLRPILMTMACVVLGSLPLVLSSGPGQHSRMDIGIVIITGMLFGTVLSLLFLPVIYYLLSPNSKLPLNIDE